MRPVRLHIPRISGRKTAAHFCWKCSIAGILLFAASGTALAGTGRCRVDDPTGTPLNVRAAPNGAILSTLSNGARVDPVEETTLGKKRWLFVARDGERLGWVFAAFVTCEAGTEARGAGPIPPAGQR